MRSSVKNKIIWTIALPIIFGNLAQTLIALTDTAFLGRVSAVALGVITLIKQEIKKSVQELGTKLFLSCWDVR